VHKVHMLRPTVDYATSLTPRRTFCGMFGWIAKNSSTEYETVEGNSFEAVERKDGVTCRRCKSGTR
jgi:hypothetical protein